MEADIPDQNMMEDKEPLMQKEEEPKNMDMQKEDPDEYREDKKLCWFMPIKCAVVLVTVFLLIDFTIELFTLVFIMHNPHYGWYYPFVYGLCLLAVFAAFLFF